ncbi:MAG: glycoside hydrolase family 127 protein [Burkholderiales bacterium]|nr:glycoside hydrolase family 127 protein [Phycisphaerae bacterium]
MITGIRLRRLLIPFALVVTGSSLPEIALAQPASGVVQPGTVTAPGALENTGVMKIQEIPPADVRLLDGPFKLARDSHAGYLLSLSADRLLSGFRKEAGLAPKAAGYGGWEEKTIAGHSLGHYLSGCAKMYASTGDERFRQRVEYMVTELAEVQAKHGNGYLGAMAGGKRIMEEQVARGDVRSKGFDLNGLWVPWYTHHKVYAGLFDAYTFCRNDQAKQVLIGFADWADSVVSRMSDEKVALMLRCEHGGMNEVLAEVYALTGQAKYKTLAAKFNDHQVIDPLTRGQDQLRGLHANTQIPKLIGAARQHELIPDEKDLGAAAQFFWNTVTQHHSYVTGGNSMNEHFGSPRTISTRLDENTTETCNTYNMMKLTRRLYAWSGDAAYFDYYERALYNHILASQNPHTAGVVYFLLLKSGSHKPFQSLDNIFTCCVGTGMENHAQYGDAIYAHSHNAVYVNLFIPSELTLKDKGVVLRQETRIPDDQSSKLTITCDRPTQFQLSIRRPAWAGEGFAASVNGEPIPTTAKPGTYVVIDRTWKTGDTVELTLPMRLAAEPTPDNPAVVAFTYGPVVLAADVGTAPLGPGATPRIVSESNSADEWLTRTGHAGLLFETTSAIGPRKLSLKPLYKIVDEHYQVYWKRHSPNEWSARETEIRAEEERVRQVEALTVDFLQPGEMQPERDHALEGEKIGTGTHADRKYRHAEAGGWLGFTLKTPAEGRADLVLTYWGGDAGRRTFDILVNDVKIATQSLNRQKPGAFVDVNYRLPPEVLAGKAEARIKLVPHADNVAGGIYGARIVRVP